MSDGTTGPDTPREGGWIASIPWLGRKLRAFDNALRAHQQGLLLHTLVLSAVISLSAVVFIYVLRACQWFFLTWLAEYHPPGLPNEGGRLVEVVGPHGLWLVPVATTLGGLIAGFLVFGFAPEAEGHGTDTAIRAFHRAAGVLRPRVAPIKTVASAITIGSGGAAGREGPVALIGATLGSTYARLLHVDEEDRRLLLLVGLAAGLAAIFRSPIGAALFAVEVLYRDMEFEAGALIYTVLGSVAAYALTGIAVGWEPLFQIPPTLRAPSVYAYGWYALLGIAAGVVATFVPIALYRTRDLFERLPGPPHLRPALGGLGLGLLALALPEVLGGGYGWIELAMYGKITLGMLLLLALGKIVAFSLTIGSGGSGGVFAPTLFVGAMLGGAMGVVFHQPVAAFVIVGMAAVFAGAAHVPIANLIMVTEMTGGYQLLVPAAFTLMLAYLVQVTLSTAVRDKGLYEAQVFSRGDSPAHHAEHLRIALRILDQKTPLPADVGRVSLLSLMMSGVPVELQDDRKLSVGTVPPKSDYVGKHVRELGLSTEHANILTIIRGEHMMAARPDTALQPGDRLLMVTSSQGWEKLKSHLVSGWSERAGAEPARPLPE